MEFVHKTIRIKPLDDCETLAELGQYALQVVYNHCLGEFNRSWQTVEDYSRRDVTEEEFLKNYLWAISVSGFSARVVTVKFDSLWQAYGLADGLGNFVPRNGQTFSKEAVFEVWKNHAKFKAMSDTCAHINSLGWEDFHNYYLKFKSPVALQRLPYMGPALSQHVARNIGNVDCVKPDKHVVRLSKKFACGQQGHSVVDFVQDVKKATSELKDWPNGKVDMLIWYAASLIR